MRVTICGRSQDRLLVLSALWHAHRPSLHAGVTLRCVAYGSPFREFLTYCVIAYCISLYSVPYPTLVCAARSPRTPHACLKELNSATRREMAAALGRSANTGQPPAKPLPCPYCTATPIGQRTYNPQQRESRGLLAASTQHTRCSFDSRQGAIGAARYSTVLPRCKRLVSFRGTPHQ